MNATSSSRSSSTIRRFILAAVALLAATFLAVTVSNVAFAKGGEYSNSASSSVEAEIDSIPGSSTSFKAGSSLAGPLIASDPTFVVADSLKGPLTEAGGSTDTALKGPLN